MHYKTNRLNHDFQIAYFMAGSCQTADAAYSLLCDLKEDRLTAIKNFEAFRLRDRAKMIRAEATIKHFEALMNDESETELARSIAEADMLQAQSDIVEMAAFAEMTDKNYKAGCAELEFIQKAMDKLTPYRRFAHLPDAEAHEAAQHEEWKLQLVHTAQNYMLSNGCIPHDHWATMRMHPEYATGIMPALDKFTLLRQQSGQSLEGAKAFSEFLTKRSYELPTMLPAPEPKALELEQGESDGPSDQAENANSR